MLSFSSLPHESKSNLVEKNWGKLSCYDKKTKTKKQIKGHEITKVFLSMQEVSKNSLGVESPVDGVHTGGEWERGQSIYFLLIVF